MTKTHNSLKINKLYNFSCFFFEEKFTAKLENGALILKISHKMKKIYAIVLMILLFFSGVPLQKERIQLKLPKLAKQPIECSWLYGSMPQAKLARATYSRCYAMNEMVRFRQHLEEANRQFLREMLRPQSQPKPSVNFTLSGDTDRLLAETLEPSGEDMAMAEAVAEPEMANAEGAYCPRARFEGETDELKVFAAADAGVFPYGTEMRVEPVASDYALAAVNGSGSAATDALAADITFWHEGEEVQPQGEVFVQLTAKREIAGDSHHSVTIDDEGNATLIAGAASQASIFNTNHFTVYGIVGQTYNDEDVEKYVRHKYVYYTGDPSAEASTWHAVAEQFYRNGDTITVPADPKGDSKHEFAGWVIKSIGGATADNAIKNGDTVTIDPETMSAEESEGVDPEPVEVKVYATYENLYQVTLYTEDKTNLDEATVYVSYVKKKNETQTLPSKKEMEASSIIPDGEGFAGWKFAGETELIEDYSVTVTGDMDIVPVFKGVKTVSFVADPLGVLPEGLVENPQDQKVIHGGTAKEPAGLEVGSEHDGYKLVGWYAEQPDIDTKEYNEEAKWNFATVIEDGTTLYAKWEAHDVSYKVIVMQELQNPPGSGSAASDFAVWSEIPAKELKGLPGDNVDIDGAINYATEDNNVPDDNKGARNTTWHYHLSGTGVRNGSAEYYAATVEHNGQVVAHYDGSSWDDAEAAVVAGDGSTVVRVYMCRNTYTLKVRFASGSSNGSNMEYGWGAYFGPTVRGSYINYLPDNNPAYGDLSDVNFEIRYRENLHSNVYLQNEKVQKLMGGSWEFLRYYGPNTGKTRFDFTNTGYNLLAKQAVKDGDTIYLGVSYVANQYEHPFRHIKYNPDGTIKEDTTTNISYSDRPHPHSFNLGSVDDGFRLEKITGGTVEWNYPVNKGSVKCEFTYDWDGNANPLVIHYYPISYAITFDPNDGQTDAFRAKNTSWGVTVPPDNFYYGDAYSDVVDDPSGAGAARYQVGYTEVINGVLKKFEGWYDNKNGEGEPYSFESKTMGNHDLRFYGKWVPVTGKVVYHKNDGFDDDVYATKDIIIGNAAERVENPTREGHVFSGWYHRDSEGKETLFSYEALTKDRVDALKSDGETEEGTAVINLYARWTVPGPFAIQYNANGGELSSKLSAQLGADNKDKKKYYGTAEAPVLGVAEKEGEIFIGWKIEATGESGAILKDGDTFKADDSIVSEWDEDEHGNRLHTGTIVLVAQYALPEQPKISVTYHTNFPEGSGQ